MRTFVITPFKSYFLRWIKDNKKSIYDPNIIFINNLPKLRSFRIKKTDLIIIYHAQDFTENAFKELEQEVRWQNIGHR